MNTYEVNSERHSQVIAPTLLLELQHNMGLAIREKVGFETGKFGFKSENYLPQISDLILARTPQSGRERLAIYNEQYWFRLFTLLQEEFPLTTATLGMWSFNQLACDYLDTFPSRSYLLDNLAENFYAFLKSNDKYATPLLVQIMELEIKIIAAINAPAVAAEHGVAFLKTTPELNSDSILKFHPGFFLFSEDWNIVESRAQVMMFSNDERDSKTFEVPKEVKGYWVIFKHEGTAQWKKIPSLQFQLLSDLQKGLPLGHACENLGEKLNDEEIESLAEQLPMWFTAWTAMRWFC